MRLITSLLNVILPSHLREEGKTFPVSAAT